MSNSTYNVTVCEDGERGCGVFIEGVIVRHFWDKEVADSVAEDYRKYPADARRALMQHARQLMSAADEFLSNGENARQAVNLLAEAKAAVNAAQTVVLLSERQ